MLYQYNELDGQQLRDAHLYYRFIEWLIEEGWEPYDYPERYINANKSLRNVRQLYQEWIKTWPESIKEIF